MFGFRKPQPQPQHLFQVRQYRGIQEGWLPIGQPRPPVQAMRLAHLADRLWPERLHKVKTH